MTKPQPIPIGFFRMIKEDALLWAERGGVAPSRRHRLRLLLLEPGYQVAFMIRLTAAAGSLPLAGKLLRRLLWLKTTRMFGSDVGVGIQIGPGLFTPHPYGIVVSAAASLGRRVTLMQGVTIGRTSHDGLVAPTLRDNVVVYAGACILGPVTIGEGAVIGANAVVLTDVPAGALAVGVPARQVMIS